MKHSRLLFAYFLVLSALAAPVRGDDWLPVTAEELSMKESPLSPGAHAVMLFRKAD